MGTTSVIRAFSEDDEGETGGFNRGFPYPPATRKTTCVIRALCEDDGGETGGFTAVPLEVW